MPLGLAQSVDILANSTYSLGEVVEEGKGPELRKLKQRRPKWASVHSLGQRIERGRHMHVRNKGNKTKSWNERLFYFHFCLFGFFI